MQRGSFVLFITRFRFKIALSAIALIAFLLRIWLSIKESFLHDWDERFHALVARNLMHNPIKPMLRVNPIIDYDPFIWCCNHIWLHKQPLFMWQMATSMKIFGVTELAMRLPSIIMGTAMVILTYRIAKLLTGNRAVGLLSALMLAFSHFHLEMIAGIKGMDHNDVALGFYILCSLWCFAEYQKSPKWYWAVGIGVFSGCAILNKWLLGLFVFLCWGPVILFYRQLKKQTLKHFILAFFICCLVFIPWQLYILAMWPDEARYVYDFNRRHIFEALEGHSGSCWYYVQNLSSLFTHLWPLFIVGIAIAFKDSLVNRKMLVAYCSGIAFVFCFFSFIVKTKVDTYLFFIAPLFMVLIAIAINKALSIVKHWLFTTIILLSVAYISLNPMAFSDYFSHSNEERQRKIHNTTIYKNLKEQLPGGYKTVINVNSFEDVELMFYHNDINAYSWWFTEEDLKRLEKEKVPIAAFKNHGNYNMPDYIYSYPYLFIIDQELR